MARSASSQDLAAIALVRGLRTQATEMRVAEATQRVRQQEEVLAQSTEQLTSLEEAWQSSMSTGVLDVDRSRRWAAGWRRQRFSHDEQERQMEMIRQEESLARERLGVERQRQELVEDEHRRTLRSERAARDERRIQEVSELLLSRTSQLS